MGDTGEGSSAAAQGAQSEDTGRSRGGFLSRIIGALSPSDLDAETAAAASGDGMAQPIVPGMVNLRRMRLEDVMTGAFPC